MRYGLSPVKRDEIVPKGRLPDGGLFAYELLACRMDYTGWIAWFTI